MTYVNTILNYFEQHSTISYPSPLKKYSIREFDQRQRASRNLVNYSAAITRMFLYFPICVKSFRHLSLK